MTKKWLHQFITNKKLFYICISVLFGLCFLFEHPHGDDTTIAHVSNGNILGIIDAIITIINKRGILSFTGVLFTFFSNVPVIFFVIFMSFIMLMILYGIDMLFDRDENISTFIALAVLSYSYIDMQSAGWIVTTCCYLVPETFSIISLLPIKKCINNEELSKKEKIVYMVSLILACGTSQSMAFLLVCYLLALLYVIIKRNNNGKYIIFGLIIVLFFSFLILTSDVNTNRMIIETTKRMPMIGMFNIINKIDIGLSSTLGWLYFGDNLFIYLTIAILSLLIIIKYKSKLFSVISVLPLLLIFMFKKAFISNMSINAFEIKPAELGTSNYGLFNLMSISKPITYVMFFTICIITSIIIVEIYMLIDNKKDLLIIETLLLAGFGSRLALILTPNIFASQQRTFIFLDFSIIITIIYVYYKNYSLFTKKYLEKIKKIFGILCIIPLAYFFAYVYNYGGNSLFDLLR